MLFKSLSKVYEGQSIEFQNKAPLLATFIAVIFFIISAIVLVLSIKVNMRLQIILPPSIELVLFIVAFGALYKGKYTLSLNIFCYAMLITIIYRHILMPGPHLENIADLTLNILLIVMIMALFCNSKKELGIISGTGLIVIILYFNTVLPAPMQDNADLLGSLIFYSFFIIFSFFLFSARKGSLRNLEKLTHTVEILNEEVRKRETVEKEIKILGGLLPICANCKKIRDDKGYWEQMESYISTHSEAEFSHSICPECTKKLYSDY